MRLLVLAAGMVRCTGHYTHTIDVDAAPPAGDAADACTGELFDRCTAADQCASGNCKTYTGAGFSVCTEACTMPGTQTCPDDATGAPALCNNMGLCKPTMPNACSR